MPTGSPTHPRLKAALMDLTGDIASTNNLVLSMEMFDSKFDNDNIHNLVVLVRQLSDTGSVAGLLSDIKNVSISCRRAITAVSVQG